MAWPKHLGNLHSLALLLEETVRCRAGLFQGLYIGPAFYLGVGCFNQLV